MSSVIKLVRKNANDFEEFGLFAFETRARLEGSHGGNVVTGRDLHAFLEVRRDYTNWFKQMVGYGFSEGQDYSLIEEETAGHPVSPNLARPRHNHIITLDMAKEISMIQRTERGKQARQYFIECERRMKQLQPELTPGCFKGLDFKPDPCSKPYLTIRLKPIIVVVSFNKDLNQARFTRDKLGQCIEPRSRSRQPRGFGHFCPKIFTLFQAVTSETMWATVR